MATFVSVVHEFKEGKADPWWKEMAEFMADPAAMQAKSAKQKELGYVNHYFLPSGGDGKINCLWEVRDAKALAGFQAFIDGPDGPAPGVFTNHCYTAMPGAMVPASVFGSEAASASEPVPTTGAMWWVFHEFNEGVKADDWWKAVTPMLSDPAKLAENAAKQSALGFHNHTFVPAAPEGPMICLWETKSDVSAEEFQAFIDGPDGPGNGMLKNTCYKCAGGFLPSAHFKA